LGNRTESLNLLILAIIAVIEKTSMLAETPFRLNAVDHDLGFDNNLGINAIIGIGDEVYV